MDSEPELMVVEDFLFACLMLTITPDDGTGYWVNADGEMIDDLGNLISVWAVRKPPEGSTHVKWFSK